MELLEAVAEHGAVVLEQHAAVDLDDQVGSESDDVGVLRGVVNLAQREPVRHDGLTLRVTIREDVRRVEELRVTKPTDRTARAVRGEHPVPELVLMQALDNLPGHVLTARGVTDTRRERGVDVGRVVDRDAERQRCRVITRDEDGPERPVPTRRDSVEVDELGLFDHALVKPSVVVALRIGALVR